MAKVIDHDHGLGFLRCLWQGFLPCLYLGLLPCSWVITVFMATVISVSLLLSAVVRVNLKKML